jgi:hypothetical protein
MNSDLNARFTDLFIVPEFMRILESSSSSCFPRMAHRIMGQVPRYLMKRLVQHDIESIVTTNPDDLQYSMGRRSFVSTWSRFYKPERGPFRFTPVERIQRRLDTYKDTCHIGVHIRRKDCAAAIAYSTTDLFENELDERLSRDNRLSFFLSTDDPEVESRMKRRYGSRMVVHHKSSLNRNDPEAIEDAVIDLYSLGSCRVIIGSHWSSFSETAAELSGGERIIINSAGVKMERKSL